MSQHDHPSEQQGLSRWADGIPQATGWLTGLTAALPNCHLPSCDRVQALRRVLGGASCSHADLMGKQLLEETSSSPRKWS